MLIINRTIITLSMILGLCLAVWVQYQKISSLKADIATQAQTISQQKSYISNLKKQEAINQKLTLEISRLESEVRSKSDEVIKSVTKEDRESKGYNADAPRAVVNFLRK